MKSLVRRVLPPGRPLTRHQRGALLAVVALAAVLRLIWVVGGAEEPASDGLPRDPGFYLALGEQVAEGHGYTFEISHDGGETFDLEPTAYYPPGYPVTLGALLWLADLLPGDPAIFDVAVVFNLVLATATVLLMFELGRRLANVEIGLFAAGVLALWPNLVIYSGVALTETLSLFLLLVLFLVALPSPETARAPGLRRLVATGLVLGMVGMVRPTSFVLAPMFVLLWWGPGRAELVTALRRTATVAAASLLVVLPWTARNLVSMDAPVLISTNFGDNLCMGHNPEATGAFVFPADHPCFDGLYDGERPRYETERQSETLRRAWRFMRDEPATVLTSMPAKARYTLREDTDGLAAATDYGQVDVLTEGWRNLIKAASNSYYALALAAGAAGLALLARRGVSRVQMFFLAAALAQLLPPLLTFGDPRFKLPVYPALAFLTAVALAWAVDRVRPASPDPDLESPDGAGPAAGALLESSPGRS